MGLISARVRTRPGRNDSLPHARKKLAEGTLLLTGDATRRRRIHHALRDLRPVVRSVAWSDELLEELEGPTVAIVLAAPIPDVPLLSALRAIRRRGELEAVPVFAVVESGLADEVAGKLYANGISAVFGWPHEARVFPRVLVETMATTHVRGAAKSSDKAFARLVGTHLKLVSVDTSRVGFDVRDGIVYLSGTIRTLWGQREVVRALGDVMGVRGVVAEDLTVARSRRTDRQVIQSIRNVLKATHDVEPATLSVVSRNGYVTIAGTVESKKELDRIEDLLVHVAGVRGIEKLATLSGRFKAAHRAVAKRLAQRLAETHPEDDVEVSYFAGVAVLSGRARSLRERRSILALIQEDAAVDRVVDKIDV